MAPLPSFAGAEQRRARCLALAVLGLALWHAADVAFTVAQPGSRAASAGLTVDSRLARAGSTLRPRTGLTVARAEGEEAAEAAAEEAADAKPIKVTALGNSRGCFILEMGGQKLLINPNLEGLDIKPEDVHKEFDYVVLTSAKDEFFHAPSLLKMNLAKVNFVAAAPAGEKLSQMLVMNLAVLAPGPGGRALLTGEKGTTPLAVMVTPGAQVGMPWDAPESGFIFIDLNTGVALAYEAMGKFLGAGASSTRDGIPEEAYQVDYVITPDLREGAGTVTGLTAKGAQLRGVVALPFPSDGPAPGEDEDTNPILGGLLALDKGLDSALGGMGDDPEDFREHLRKEGGPLADTRLLLPTIGGEAVLLE